jgi:hypothetical protein
MPISLTIAGISFESKQAAIEHCRAILHRGSLNSEIVGEDRRFVAELLHLRPDKVKEMNGREPVRYFRMMHRRITPSFFVELDDETLMDFSFMKFINSYPRATAA